MAMLSGNSKELDRSAKGDGLGVADGHWYVFGVRLYLLVNVSLFLVFSGLCGTASELTQMMIYRALQGFTGGVMIPIGFGSKFLDGGKFIRFRVSFAGIP